MPRALQRAAATTAASTQLVVTWLNHALGNPHSLTWYLIATDIAGVAAMAMMAETAPARTAPMLAANGE